MRWLLLPLALSCGPAAEPLPAAGPRAPEAEPIAPAPPTVTPDRLRVDVLDRSTLDELEATGWAASDLWARVAPPTGAVGPDLASQAAHSPPWRALSDQLTGDLQETIDAVDRPLVVELADALAWPAGNVGRAFDTRWLRSGSARWSLAGVVNRLDRRDLHERPTCGEVRLVYRLAYTLAREGGATVGSRLPVTLNAVFVPRSEDCGAVARGWADLPDEGLAAALAAGPLADLALDRVEVNAQAVRFPSGVETEFAGQALYLLQVYRFEAADGRVEALPQPLENTIDVTRLQADDALRAELVAWLGDHLGAIDLGTYRIPDRYLATRALSWSTLGIHRSANRPFSALFSPDLSALPDPSAADRRFLGDRRGLVERLDNGTCMGCHQAGSTAGFHLLGPDGATAGVTNRLAQPVSPHLSVERPRRRAYAAAVASGREPDRLRAHSLSPGAATVAPNQPCLPADQQGALAPGQRWTCDTGAGPVTCLPVAHDPRSALTWGQCMPEDEDRAALTAGMTCRAGAITAQPPSGDPWNHRAHRDTVSLHQTYALAEDKRFSTDALNCRPTVIGVPLGRTYRRCTAAERALEGVLGDDGALAPEICAVVGGTRFDQCVEEDFHACLEQIVGRGMVAACDADHPCREDAICQALPWQLDGLPAEAGRRLAEAGVGFCTPTYFLFQLRLDGHPVPSG